jgi:hypothetical protein
MRKSRFSEEQIIGMLREHEIGWKVAGPCRKYGIPDATFDKYKAKFGRDARCVREVVASAKDGQIDGLHPHSGRIQKMVAPQWQKISCPKSSKESNSTTASK